MKKKQMGYAGELTVAKYLKGKNWLILSQNYTIRGGEIDLIALDHGALVFVEVKTRTSNLFGSGREQFTKMKKQRLKRASLNYLSKHPSIFPIRYDYVFVEMGLKEAKKIQHYKNVSLN